MGKHSDKRTKRQGKGGTEQTNAPYSRLYLIEDCIIGLLFLSVLLLFSTSVSANFTLPKLVALRICTFFLACLWMYRISKREAQPIPRVIFLSGIALGVWWLFSTFFALHSYTAIHGVHGRYNGLYTHELWLMLFFIFATLPGHQKRIERIINLFIVSLIPVALYALAQFCNIDPLPWVSLKGRTSSTIGHPVMLSALVGLALPFTITFLFQKKRQIQRISYGLACVLFVSAAASTLSRGPLIGIVLSCIFIIIMNMKAGGTVKRKSIIVATVSLVLIVPVLFIMLKGTAYVMSRITSGEEVEIRLIYFKTAMNITKDHPLTGVGFENFRIIYPRYRMAEENRLARDVVPTMVHNGYLQSAAMNGIPGIMLYLFFLGAVILSLIRTSVTAQDTYRSTLLWAFIASIAGFLIQDMSGWLEISQTTFFWIILGLATAFSSHNAQQKIVLTGRGSAAACAAVAACCAFLFYLSFEAINRTWADSIIWKTKVYNKDIAKKEIEAPLIDALETLRGDFYYEDLAGMLYANKYKETDNERFYRKAEDMFEKAYRDDPHDVYVLTHRIELEALAMRKGHVKKPSPFVEKAAANILIMDKNNPSVYHIVVMLRMAEGNTDVALQMLERSRVLAPESSKHFLLEGDVYHELKRYDKALHAYSQAITYAEKERLESKWERRGHPRMLTWLSAQYGLFYIYMATRDYQRACTVMQEVIASFPDSSRHYVMIGDAYGMTGDIKKAKESFGHALKRDPDDPFAKKGYLRCVEILQKGQGSR
jgi:O-antigen ligase/tetratricopeptide (TPR) repeat protein